MTDSSFLRGSSRARTALALSALAVAAIALGAAPARADHVPDYDTPSEDWMFGGFSSPLGHGDSVRLDEDLGPYVVYGEREYGINLIRRSTSAAEWTLLISDGGVFDDLHYDQPFALYNESAGAYVEYGAREYGIDLVWDDDPSYEWSLRGYTGHGVRWREWDEVLGSSHVGLFNHAAGLYVVEGEREYGIDLVWTNVL